MHVAVDNFARVLLAREERLRQDRATLDSLCQETAEYVIPRRALFWDQNTPGPRRQRRILDSTAPRSLELFASFLHTMLNNPAQRWINLTVLGDQKLSRQPRVRRWLEDAGTDMLTELASPSAGVYLNAHKLYLDLGWAGTGIFYSEMTPARRIVTRTYHMANCVLLEGENGFIDGIMRRHPYTARQAKQKWPGVPLGRSIDEVKEQDLDKRVPFMHVVLPADDPMIQDERSLNSVRMRFLFASVWINMQDRVVVWRGGYYEFPYQTPRWYTVENDVYGRSPAMSVMPDIRLVNRMSDTVLRGAEKIVDPPLLLPDGAMVSPVRLFPGGISYSDGAIDPKTLIPPGTSRIETGNDLLVRRQENIREGFFVPLFSTPDSPVKTATQVLQEGDERNRAVSPMIVRSQAELHHPFIGRVYNLKRRAGTLPPAPEELDGKLIAAEYVSPLIAAQKQIEGLGIARLFEAVAPWAQVDPGMWDRYDVDEIAEVASGASGAPARVLRGREEANKVRKERAKQQREQEAMAAGVQGADAAAKLITANARAQQVANA